MLITYDRVVLVDEEDNAIGNANKTEAHAKGWLHRAFSVLLFNDKKELLLQQRAFTKYHCGGLWTNTCCSHPLPNEDNIVAAQRRLKEELGIKCNLYKSFFFIYKANVDNGLIEYEYDHVFFGNYNDPPPAINHQEIADWRYSSLPELHKDITSQPEKYTPWFKLILQKMKDEKLLNYKNFTN